MHPILEIPTNLTFEKIKKSAVSPKNIPFWQIPSSIAELQKNGMSSSGYEVYWQRLWAEIVLLGFMAVLAVGFCLHTPRNNNISKLIITALISGFLIHFFSKIVHAYGEAERLSPLWAAWLPPLVIGFLGIGYLMHVDENT